MPPAGNEDDGPAEASHRSDSGIHIGRFGVVIKINVPDAVDPFQPVRQTPELLDGFRIT
jgi:hypothetical protein